MKKLDSNEYDMIPFTAKKSKHWFSLRYGFLLMGVSHNERNRGMCLTAAKEPPSSKPWSTFSLALALAFHSSIEICLVGRASSGNTEKLPKDWLQIRKVFLLQRGFFLLFTLYHETEFTCGQYTCDMEWDCKRCVSTGRHSHQSLGSLTLLHTSLR